MYRTMLQICIGWLAAALTLTGMPAQAGMIGTEQLVATEAHASDLSTVETFVAREDVRAQFEAWGVAPELAAERVAHLSPAELRQLAANIESQPAGGDAIVIIGVVFLVLLILELLGVTNVFTAI